MEWRGGWVVKSLTVKKKTLYLAVDKSNAPISIESLSSKEKSVLK